MNKQNNVTASIQPATRHIVESLLEANTKNRIIKPGVVSRYRQDIRDGRWYLTNQGIGVYEDGTLADGQHRLLAITEEKAWGLPLLIVRGLSFDAIEGIDQHAKRSMADVMKLVIDVSIDCRTVAAMNVLIKDELGWPRSAPSPTAHVVRDYIGKYADEMAAIYSAVKNKGSFAAPFYAAACYAIKHRDAKDRVVEFIKAIESMEGLQGGTPEHALAKFLRTMKGSSGGGGVQKERFFKTLHAIYAAIDGTTRHKLYATDPRI